MENVKAISPTAPKYDLLIKVAFLLYCASLFWLGTTLHAAITHSNEFRIEAGAPYYLDAGTGILIGAGEAHPGLDLRFNARLQTDPPLYLGAEMGMFYYSNRGNAGAVIPLLGTISTLFHATSRIHPTFGLSLGPVISTGSSYSSARFALLLDPGARFELGQDISLCALTRFGVIGSTFVALPQAALSISF